MTASGCAALPTALSSPLRANTPKGTFEQLNALRHPLLLGRTRRRDFAGRAFPSHILNASDDAIPPTGHVQHLLVLPLASLQWRRLAATVPACVARLAVTHGASLSRTVFPS